MGFKTQDGFQFTGSGDGLKYVSGKRISFYISEQGNPGESATGTLPTENLELYINPSTYTSGTTISDSSGNNRTYDLKNGVAHNNSPSRFTFDGTNDYLEAASNYSSDIVTNTGTFVAWIKRDGTQSTYAGLMIDRSVSATGMNLYSNEHALGYSWNNSFNTYGWDSDVIVPDDTWSLVAIVVSSTEVKAYLYTTSSTPTTAQNTNSHSNATFRNVNIGRDSYGIYFKGDIGHVLFYSGALQQSQLTSIYNATKTTYYKIIQTNLVLYLDAGISSSYSGSGTTWSDISGNNNNFTLTNGPTFTSSDGGAIVFDGTNDFAVSALNQAFFQFGTADYSYGIWFKLDSVDDNYASILSSGGGENGSWQMDTYLGNNQIRHILKDNNGSNQTLFTSTNSISANTWLYLFVVNDRSENELKIYLNGTINATGSNSSYGSTDVGNFDSATDAKNVFNIASNRAQDYFIDGSVAQVHVYKGKALTASEVLENYNNTKTTYGY